LIKFPLVINKWRNGEKQSFSQASWQTIVKEHIIVKVDSHSLPTHTPPSPVMEWQTNETIV
jgi:hypothetical protein